MKVDFSVVVTDLRGKPVKFEVSAAEKDAAGSITTPAIVREMTLADLAYTVLEDPTAGAMKRSLGKLQASIVAGGIVDIAEGDVDLILKQVEKSQLPPSLFNRAEQLLRRPVKEGG